MPRRPLEVAYDEDQDAYSIAMEGVRLGERTSEPVWLTAEELRWLALVLIPAALPQLPVPGLADREDG